MNYIIIGRGGHGKDTVKDFISSKVDIKQARMAYYLKDMLIDILELENKTKYKDFYKKDDKWFDKNDEFVSIELLDILKDESSPYEDKELGFKSSKDLRMMMIHLGTEYFRALDNDFNIKTIGRKVLKENDNYVFTDIRFKNEFDFSNYLAIKENKEELIKYSDNYNIPNSFSDLKNKFINIVLGSDVIFSKRTEKRIDNKIKEILNMNTNISYDLKDIKLSKHGKKDLKILRIFRVITDKDFKNQKKVYTENLSDEIKKRFDLDCSKDEDLKKAMSIIGFIRPGFESPEKVFHPSEFELGLKKPYYEYSNLIYASNLKELEKKVMEYIDIDNKKEQEFELN